MAVLVAAGVPPGREIPGGVVLLELEHVMGDENPLLLAFVRVPEFLDHFGFRCTVYLS